MKISVSVNSPPAKSFPFILLAAFNAISPMSIDMYLPGWTALAQYFHCSVGDIQLSLSAFLIGFGIGQLIWGPVSDCLGRRPMVFVGGIVYIFASLLCLSTTDVSVFIALRLLQGLGACAAPVMSKAIVRDCFDQDSGARIFSLIMVITLFVPMLGPAVGGILLTWYGWPSIFWVLAGAGFLNLILAAMMMTETLDARDRERLSLPTLVKSYGAVLKDRLFLGYTLTGGFLVAGLFAYLSSVSYLILVVYNVSPERFGIYFGVNLIGQGGMAYINSLIVRRFGSDLVLRYGMGLSGVAAAVLTYGAVEQSGSMIWVAIPLFWFLCSMPLTLGNALACSLTSVSERAGTASAVSGAVQCVMGAALGAVAGSGQDGTARSLAITILLSVVAAILSYLVLVRPGSVGERASVPSV